MGNTVDFIPRKFKDLRSNRIINFNEIIQSEDNFISVILGEPASGKTYQLKIYHEENQTTCFALKARHIKKNKSQEQQTLLFDSIDEALISYPTIKDDLLDYIENNTGKKFILTCRYLEWKENFEKELNEIDDTLKVYEIEALSREDINKLLQDDDIDKFWDFIEKNHLQFLLKNIMIIKYLIDNWKKYNDEKQNINYTSIYKKIIYEKFELVVQGRDEENTDKNTDKLILIASSLATYMMLCRLDNIPSSELNKTARHCYKVNNQEIVADNLKIVFNKLGEKKDNNFVFFHKSIQEYLTAYFINYKKLDFETIKEIFAHKLRFYEEFEEVIIYLTNIEPKYFKDIVNFDPFIFRRHPSLNEIEQRQLLVSVLHKVQHEEWMINSTKSDLGKWGTSRWILLNGSTIFKYGELSEEDLYNLVIENIKEAISLTTFTFLIKLIEFNKNKNLEDYILKYLEKIPSEKQIEYITNGFELTGTFVSEGSFNLNLVHHDIFTENFLNHYIVEEKTRKRLDRFISNLIRFLYIQKDKCNNINFEIIFKLLVNIENFYNLSNVIPLFQVEDTKEWLNLFLQRFEKYESHNLDPHHASWLVYSLLKNKVVLGEILSFLDKYPFIDRPFIDLRMLLDINDIDSDFWELFFNCDENGTRFKVLPKILTFYRINSLSVVIQKYPIQNFFKYYVALLQIPYIAEVLNRDEIFVKYLKENYNENYRV